MAVSSGFLRGVKLFNLLAFCVLFFSLVNFPTAEARVRRYKWEVKYEYRSPDCFKKLVITINGRTPGPTILAQQNDTIIVELKNSLVTENVAIHWHGIRQVSKIYETKMKIPFQKCFPQHELNHNHFCVLCCDCFTDWNSLV